MEGDSVSLLERAGPIDRAPETPGFDKKVVLLQLCLESRLFVLFSV